MTTPPPELPDGPSEPVPPPPPLPPSADPAAPQPSRYNMKQVWITAIGIMVVIALVSWVFPPAGLLVPVIFFVSIFFLLKKDQSVSYRSGLAGVLLGFGLGIIVTAGVCTAVFNSGTSVAGL